MRVTTGAGPSDRSSPSGSSSFSTLGAPVLAPLLAAAFAFGIFVIDTLAPYGFALAVLYVVVVLLSASFCGRRGILLVSAACVGLTTLSYLMHGSLEDLEPLVRSIVSVAAIVITTVLVLRNQVTANTLREQARLLDLTHDTVFARDMRNIVTYWNKGAEEVYGWPRDEALGRTTHSLLQTVFPAPFRDIEAELLRTGRWEGELVHTRRDGTQVTMQSRWHLQRDERGRPTTILEANTDITERKRAAMAALQHERQLQLTIDTIPTLVWSAFPDGTVDFVNARWEESGFSAADLRSNWPAIVHPDDLDHLRTAWLAALRSGQTYESEARLRRREGGYRWFLNRAVPLRDEAGVITKWYAVSIDIEDRKQAEQALHQTQAELAHVTRMRTLGELAASIAHEVNQPLAGISTHGEACLRWLGRDEPQLGEVRSSVERMIGDGHRASEVISRLRALAKRAPLRPVPQNLNDTLEDALPLVRGELPRHRIVLKLERATDLPMVLADRIHLQQVFINLILNGIQAMDAVSDRPRELLIRTFIGDDGQVRLAVRDRGVGIDPAHMGRLFEPFFTTKPEGMGMGLSISRAMIEANGGRIWASGNDDGPGATFHVALPAQPTIP